MQGSGGNLWIDIPRGCSGLEWHMLPGGLAMFAEKYGERAQVEVDERTDAAYSGIPVTLAAIKRIAESRRPIS